MSKFHISLLFVDRQKMKMLLSLKFTSYSDLSMIGFSFFFSTYQTPYSRKYFIKMFCNILENTLELI